MRKGRVWLGMAAGIAMLAACGGAEVAPPTATSPTPTVAATPAVSPTPTATATPVASPTPTATATPAAVPTPTATPTASPLPAPVVMRYGAPQPTGIVDAPGEYAFFSADGPVTTYEGLRQDVERLVIHERDADGASWEAFYDEVAAGDDFEWREADDCWVRYLVDKVLPDPTDAPLKALAVRRYGYAYTGCSGTVAATGDRTWTWAPPNIQSPDITVPVRHGPWLLSLPGWEDEPEVIHASAQTQSPSGAQGDSDALSLPPWREPRVPEGWVFRGRAWGDPYVNPINGFTAYYDGAHGYKALEIHVLYPTHSPYVTRANRIDEVLVKEAMTIDGYPALLHYSPEHLPNHARGMPMQLWIFDQQNGIEYALEGYDPILKGGDADPLIAIARTLLPDREDVRNDYGGYSGNSAQDCDGRLSQTKVEDSILSAPTTMP